MLVFSISYKFNQHLPVPAREAFDWCTDYLPNDLALMGEKGKRRINIVAADTVILEEQVVHGGKRISKIKLVKLNRPAFSWHNIHLQGPNKYSEFIYQIAPEGPHKSKLTFTGLLLVYSTKRINRQTLRQIANREKGYDSRIWKRLASEMAKDLRNA